MSASLDLRTACGLGVTGCCLVGAGLVIPVAGLLLLAVGGGMGVAGLVTHHRVGGDRRWAVAAVVAAVVSFAVSIALGLVHAADMENFD